MVQTDVINALASKVYSIFNGGPPSNPNTDIFISFINGGYPFSADDLAFLEPNTITASPPTKVDQARYFSNQVNRIPSNIGNWNPTSGFMTVPYRDSFLGQGQPYPNNPLTPQQLQEVDNLKNTLRNLDQLNNGYTSYRKNWRNAQDNLMELTSTPVNKRALFI